MKELRDDESIRGAGAASESDSDEALGVFMTVDDVAEMLRINKSTVYRMAKQGRLPATRVGRQWRFRQSALEEFLDSGGELVLEEGQEEPRRAFARW